MEYYINLAIRLSEESVGLRFRAKSLALALFLEFFATKKLIRFLSLQRHEFVYDFPTYRKDIENQVRQHFPDYLADPLISLIDASGTDFKAWAAENLPDDITENDFQIFLTYGAAMIRNWQARHQHERQTIRGVEWASFICARLMQGLVIIGYLWTLSPWVLSLTMFAMLLSAVVCARGIPVT